MPRPPTFPRTFPEKEILAQLVKADPRLKSLFKKVGAFKLAKPKRGVTPFAWLVRSIIYQQLHGKAAASIHARLRANFNDKDPTPEELAAINPETMREAGLSRQKIAALKDLARAGQAGLVPDRKGMRNLSDEQIIAQLTEIKGVGRWTVEMLLMFGLGRTDVLALDDYAIKKAIVIHYKLREPIKKDVLNQIGASWSPWRSVVSWYLWRSLD